MFVLALAETVHKKQIELGAIRWHSQNPSSKMIQFAIVHANRIVKFGTLWIYKSTPIESLTI